MKLYLAIYFGCSAEGESTTLYGIFSSEELAKEAIPPDDYCSIIELTLDQCDIKIF